jgi:uncharacterized protein (DUF342 family)
MARGRHARRTTLLSRLWPGRGDRRRAEAQQRADELWDLSGEVSRLRTVGVQHAGLAARAEMRAHRAEGRVAQLEEQVATLRAELLQLREELAFAWSAGRIEAEAIESAGLAATVIDLRQAATS